VGKSVVVLRKNEYDTLTVLTYDVNSTDVVKLVNRISIDLFDLDTLEYNNVTILRNEGQQDC
jgi:hypothetical protein